MTIQDISKGRMGVFYDYGWRKEFNSYKYQDKNKELRISEMDESIGILKEFFLKIHLLIMKLTQL